MTCRSCSKPSTAYAQKLAVLATLLGMNGCGGTGPQVATIDVGFDNNAFGAGALFKAIEQDWEDQWWSDCTEVVHGACKISTCTPPPAPPEDPTYLEAGPIEITSDGAFSASGVPTTTGRYSFSNVGTFVGGETITVRAIGGRVAKFEGTVRVPQPPLLTSPVVLNPPTPVIVTKSKALELTWQAPHGGYEIRVYDQRPDQGEGSQTSLSCAFPAEQGAGVIPTTILADLPSGTNLAMQAVSTEVVPTPQGDVHLRGFAHVTGVPVLEVE